MSNKSKIQRLILYRIALIHFKSMGFQRIFSYNIAGEVGVSPEQVRKDFSEFNIRGNKKAGYEISELLSNFDRIFQKDKTHHVILVGMGNIGSALANYQGFRNSGIFIKAAFDKDITRAKGDVVVPLYPLENLSNFVKSNRVKIAILAVPFEAAQSVANLLIDSGIKGIMNFTYANLRVPDDVYVKYVSLTNTLESLIFLTNQNDSEE
ncbi:MAG: redox-sensing transcriptional repressor Rex [Bacteroidia bacterium]|nr:MAG: redox-sensing transcriptional repressor Rex [Bacteroidia bacterium]